MKAFKAILLAGAAIAAMTAPSFADTATGGTIGTSGPTDYSTQMGYLAKFNPDAGTLTGVSFTVGYGFTSTITVTASTDSTGNVSTESAAQFDSSDSAIKSILNSVVNKTSAVIGSTALSPAAYDLQGNKSIYNVGPSFGGGSQQYSSVNSASNTYAVNASDFSAFLANPSSAVFDVYGLTLTGLNLTATGGNASATQKTVANQSISVLYTYTPTPTTTVPEPASFALLGAGLVGLGLLRRKSA